MSTPPRIKAAPIWPWYLKPFQQIKPSVVSIVDLVIKPCQIGAQKIRDAVWEEDILKEHLLQHGHGSDDACLTSSAEAVELQLTADQGRRHFCISGGSSTTAVHVGSQVVDLFAVLVGDNRSSGGTGIGTEDETVLVNQSNDSCSSLCRLGNAHALALHHCVAITI